MRFELAVRAGRLVTGQEFGRSVECLDQVFQASGLPAIERVGGAPVVIKLLEGTQGIGVILAPDTKVAEAVIETLQSTGRTS